MAEKRARTRRRIATSTSWSSRLPLNQSKIMLALIINTSELIRAIRLSIRIKSTKGTVKRSWLVTRKWTWKRLCVWDIAVMRNLNLQKYKRQSPMSQIKIRSSFSNLWTIQGKANSTIAVSMWPYNLTLWKQKTSKTAQCQGGWEVWTKQLHSSMRILCSASRYFHKIIQTMPLVAVAR